MTASVTVAGYVAIVAVALGFEGLARRSGRFATFADALRLALRRRAFRVLLQAGWLWVGWHLFVRVEWR